VNEKEIDKTILNSFNFVNSSDTTSKISSKETTSKEFLEVINYGINDGSLRFSDNTKKIVTYATEEVTEKLSYLLERPSYGIIKSHLALLALSLVLNRLCIEFPIKRIERIGEYKFSNKLYLGLEFLAKRRGLDFSERRTNPKWWIEPIVNRLVIEGLDNEYSVKAIKAQIEVANCPDRISPRAYAIALASLHSGKEIKSTILAFSKLFNISCRRIIKAIVRIDVNAVRRLSYTEKREMLISDSIMQNHKVDSNLCFYTPSETLECLTSGKLAEWYEKLDEFEYDFDYKSDESKSNESEKKVLLLFPCAASKPWSEETTHSSTYKMLYSILKEVGLRNKVKIATISEPLAVVPEELYHEMPIYDCPGLFHNYVHTWQLPWDRNSYIHCIHTLGNLIGKFLRKHFDKFSNIHAIVQLPSPHYEMMLHAKNTLEEEKQDKVILHQIDGKIRENRTKVKDIVRTF